MTNKIILGLCTAALFVLFGEEFSSAYNPQKEKPPYYLTNEELDAAFNVKSETQMNGNYVRVLYFHRIPGCSACQLMSKYVYETIRNYYSEEAGKREVILRYYNFDDPKNAELAEVFKITAPSLVLIQGRNGKDIKAKHADKIWSLAGDKQAFIKYVHQEINEYLKPENQTQNNE